MVEHGHGPQSGTRDNGLRAARYVAIGDYDPRIADAALSLLRDDGIAAYVAPTPGLRGGYLELRLPTTPTDRLYVDEDRAEAAVDLLAGDSAAAGPELPEDDGVATDQGGAATERNRSGTDLDVDAAWEQVLLSLRSTESGDHPWPDSEDVAEPVQGNTADVVAALDGPPEIEDVDEHFVPPAPPPLPRLHPQTVVCLIAIIGGFLVNATGFDSGDLDWLGVAAVIGGAIGLVWRTKDEPPDDFGSDDGAVV
jgi:hypothetical protein